MRESNDDFYLLINVIFLIPLIGAIFLPVINYGYFPPILFILILEFKHRKLKPLSLEWAIKFKNKNICFLLFYSWCLISILFTILFYEEKLANFNNLASIILIHITVMRFLRSPDVWIIFIKNICWFIFYFLVFNFILQLLPIPLGQFIFERVSGFNQDTTGFRYVSVIDSIKSFPSPQFPLSLPADRNHGVSFLATIGIAGCVAILKFNKYNNFATSKIIATLFFYSTLMFFAYSRTTLVTIAIVFFTSVVRLKHKVLFVFFGLIVFMLMSSNQFMYNLVIDMFRIDTNDFEKTGSGREVIVELHQRMIYLKPLTGWGFIIPYDEFNYDTTKNAYSESGLTFVLATQGLIRGSLYISLLVVAVIRNFVLAEKNPYHNFMYFTTVLLLSTFLFQGGLTGVSSSLSTISHVLLAIALYSEPISNQQSSSSLDTI